MTRAVITITVKFHRLWSKWVPASWHARAKSKSDRWTKYGEMVRRTIERQPPSTFETPSNANSVRPRKQGRPAYTWEGGCTWIVEAVASDPWMRSRQDFVFSRCRLIDRVKSCIFFVCLRLKGARSGPASFDFDFGFVHTEVVLRHNTQRFAWNYSLRAMYDG